MNDDELRAAAEEVARALGLNVEGYVCPWCGFNPGRATPEKHYEQDTCPTCQFSVEYETRPLDLLTEAGAAALWDNLVDRDANVAIRRYTDTGGHKIAIAVISHGDIAVDASNKKNDWPAALVLAAHAALRAGWLEGEGGDATV